MTATTRSKSLIIKGARENNLKNIDVEIPREQLVVVTGLSGSGKSSLAFETIYAEGQRRFLESLSAYARRRVDQVKKPDVDFVYGLSPVVSIEQKTVSRNPRSTIGTMTDIYDFIRVLYATAGVAHCPYCHAEVPIKTPHQIAEHLLALPVGTAVEICAPVFKIYGEDYAYLLAEIRNRGHRRMYVDDRACDISEDMELDEDRIYALEAVIDKFVVKQPGARDGRRDIRHDIEQAIATSIQNGLRVGEGFVRFRILGQPTTDPSTPLRAGDRRPTANGSDMVVGDPWSVVDFWNGFACPQHHVTMGELKSYYFAFNDPDSACRSCSGLGTYYKVHTHLLVVDPARGIKGGCFMPEAYSYSRDSWPTKLMVSVAAHYGFSLDTPFNDLPPKVVEIVFYGTKGERFPIVMPEGARSKDHTGLMMRFEGIINTIERRYKHFRQEQTAHTEIETYLKRVMVEHTCPDCNGTKLKRQRLLVTLKGRNIYDLGEMNLAELRAFLEHVPLPPRQRQAGEQVIAEIKTRLELLLGIGVDYLSLNRKAGTLSGGESQRIRLSNQIGSGLMGMLYVLDEPSIGLHPKDNLKMIRTLQRLRDIGNSVIVVEHDEDTIRAADHILEIGPGPGVHGGAVVAQGTIDEILSNPQSLTGAYLSGKARIALPAHRRPFTPSPLHPIGTEGVKGREGERAMGWLKILGARENNLKNLDVEIPLGLFICVTGASGSGKSSLINEILYKQLYSVFHDSRVLPGRHDRIEGLDQITDVINIDQSPIGRTPRSNPATYIGFYDDIRRLFANTPEAKARDYSMGRFSFNVKGGRCEECAGEGLITTSLHFMPDVESPCPICKGARYNEETLEVTYAGKNIADILDMTVEEGETFFKQRPYLVHKIGMLNALGLGYLRLGQSSTTLSGGEAQRIKLASELGKIKRGNHNFYILDEPTTGLHLADIQKLLDSLNRLVNAGNTVLVIEHHLDVIKTADYVIDLGPDGGHNGGEIIVQGTPEEVAHCPQSYTGQYLRRYLPEGA